MRKFILFSLAILCIFALIQSAEASRHGGAPRYKYTKSYVTKKGQYRSGAIKDVSANGNKFDNANALGLNGRRG